MAQTMFTTPPVKRSAWRRKLAPVLGGLVLLLIIFYFVATSAAFFKGVILPRVSKTINAEVTVADASISLFSQVILRGLKVQTTGTEPLVKVEEVRAHYRLWAILRGHLAVQEVTLISPVIELVENADGTSNLDPFTKPKKGEKEKKPSAEKKPGEPIKLDIKKVAVKNAVVRMTKQLKGGSKEITELTGLNLTAENLKNAATARLKVDANVKLDRSAAAPATGNDQLGASWKSSFNVALDANLNPKTVQGEAHLLVGLALGAFKDLAALNGSLVCDVSPTEIKQGALTFTQSGKNLGAISASGPLDLAKREGKVKVEVSAIDRQVLNLAGAAMGLDFNSTLLNSSNQIELSKNGQLIAVNGQLTGGAFSVTQKGQTTPPIDLRISYHLTVDQISQTALVESFTLEGHQQQQALLRGALSKPMKLNWGKADRAVDESAFDLTLTNANLADWRAFAGDYASAGQANLKVVLLSQQAGRKLKLDVASQVTGLSATIAGNKIDQAEVTLIARGTMDDFSKIQLAEFNLQVARENQTALSCTGAGTYDSDKKSGQLALKLVDLNQNGLRPFLESMLGDKKLVSVSINGTSSASYDAQGDSAVKADLQLTKLVVSDPKKQLPATPLEARFQVDTSWRKQILDLRQCQVTLSPTARAKNEVQLQGQVELSKTNTIQQGALKLVAESLDVTPYYDLFAGQPKTAGTKTSKTLPKAAPTEKGETEPAAINLPFNNFTLEANIGRFYLREMEIANWQTTVKLDRSRVLLKPFQLTLNGAPVNASADLNLGMPGYQFDLSFSADKIPLTPLVNSFQPDRKGQMGGVFTANAKMNGAGVTGVSLQKNLTGQFNMAATNLNLAIANVKSPILKSIINIVIAIPNLLRNPTAAVGNLLGQLTGASNKENSGWVDQLTASPIRVVMVRGSAGNGRVDLQASTVRSDAFQADAHGDLRLATGLTNSALQVPVSLSLRRTLADKIGLVNANAPTNQTYFPMPDFLTMTGTVGDPKTHVDKVALTALAAKTLGAALTGSKAGNFLKEGAGLLTGEGRSKTNTPSTNESAPFNPLEVFKKPKKK